MRSRGAQDVALKQTGQDDHYGSNGQVDQSGVELQAMRAGFGTVLKPKPEKSDKIALIWQVFGGTILSIVALAFVTIYNNLTSNISELRGELNRTNTELRSEIARTNEARADLVRKDEFTTRSTTVWDGIKTLQAQNNTQLTTLSSQRAEVDTLKERLNRQTADFETLKKDQALSTGSLKTELIGVDTVKEKLTSLVAELKSTRDDVQRMRMELDRNQAYDNERKEHRDKQYRQTDEVIKELQKGIQDCREKLARMEGQYGPPASSPIVPKKANPPRSKPDETLPPPTPKLD